MDLLNGLILANAPISQQNAVGSYIEGNQSGQAAAKTKIENENALYQQNLQLRLQKSIQDSVNPDGSLNYNLLAINGAKNGIAPQMLDYTIKTLPAQWESLAKTAQSKMLLRTQSPSGYNEIQNEVNTKWSNQPVNKPAKTSTNPSQSSTKAAAVPSEDNSSNAGEDNSSNAGEDNSSNAGDSSLNNTDDGSTAKNYVYLTPNEKYTSNIPIKDVDGQIVNAGSQTDLAADTSGFVTPDMLQSNQITSGSNAVSESNGQVNIGASTLNPNAVDYDTLSPDLSTDPFANYGNQTQNGNQTKSVDNNQNTDSTNPQDNTQNTDSTNPFDIANKMDVINPSQMLGQGNGVGDGNRSYFQVTNQTTDEALNTIRRNLERNANLPEGASIELINKYLREQQDKDYAAVGPAPVLLPDAEGRYDYNDYGKRMQEWQKNLAKVSADWAEKFGKEYADQLTQQIAKDANDRAELQLQNDATKYNNDIDGRNQYAKQITTTLGATKGLGGKLDASTFGSIKEMQDFAERASAFKQLDIIPTNALGELGWAKNFIQAEGLGEAEGTMKLVQLLAAKDPLIRAEIELTYGGNLGAVGLQEVAKLLGKVSGGELIDLKKEMKFPLDWKTHTGVGELKPMRGTAPETTDREMDKGAPKSDPSGSDTIVKKGWYNSPAKATGDTFQTDSGNIYKVASRGPVSGLPKTVIDDDGTIYKVNDRNPADPNAKVDLVPVGGASTSGSTPWSKRPAKVPKRPAKVPNKPSTSNLKVGTKNSKGQVWTGKRWL